MAALVAASSKVLVAGFHRGTNGLFRFLLTMDQCVQRDKMAGAGVDVNVASAR
ncbi:MAG: hypothetical protein WBL16_09085 [Zwartia sp.]